MADADQITLIFFHRLFECSESIAEVEKKMRKLSKNFHEDLTPRSHEGTPKTLDLKSRVAL